jgi:hypothetical protein
MFLMALWRPRVEFRFPTFLSWGFQLGFPILIRNPPTARRNVAQVESFYFLVRGEIGLVPVAPAALIATVLKRLSIVLDPLAPRRGRLGGKHRLLMVSDQSPSSRIVPFERRKKTEFDQSFWPVFATRAPLLKKRLSQISK